MRLFHVSEDSNINIFNPRFPTRDDLDKSIGLVWGINEKCLPNFLTPRDCPRVTYHIGKNTSQNDITRYISSNTIYHILIIENKWFEQMKISPPFLDHAV